MILTYHLRSSVLGGAVIEELNASGQKQLGYVYTPTGTQLATQYAGQNYVSFKQLSPLNTTQRGVSSLGSTSRLEFDPLGATVKTNPNSPADHSGGPGDIPSGGSGSLDSRFSSIANPTAGCVVDGTYMPCALAFRGEGTSSDVVYVDPFFAATPYRSRGKKPVWVESDTTRYVETPEFLFIYAGTGGYYVWVDDPDSVLEVFTQPAGASGSGGPQNTAPDANAIRDGLKNALSRVDCSAIVNNLLNSVATKKNPRVTQVSPLAMFDSLVAGSGGLTRVRPPGCVGSACPTGSLQKGNAGIFLDARPFGPEDQLKIDIQGALAELMHLGGQNAYYTDRDFAEIVHRDFPNLTTSIWPGDPADTYHKAAMKDRNNISWSYYWHQAVDRLCFGPRGEQ